MTHKTHPKPKTNSGEGEQIFDLLFESHSIPMLVYDLKTLAIQRVNDAAVRKYGYSRDEFQAMTLKDVLSAQDGKKKQSDLPHSGKGRHQSKNGHLFDVRATTHPLEYEGHKTILMMAQDIGEYGKMEENLADSEVELHALFASMQDLVMVIDGDGNYCKIAPTNPVLLFKPTEELLGKNLRDVFTAEQAETFLNAVQQVLVTQHSIRIEYELLIGKRLTWFSASISPMDAEHTLWVVRDITDRKQAEAAMRESEERYHTLFDSMMDGIYRSTHEGKFVDINPAMVKMFGYSSREEMLEVDIKNDLYFAAEERGSHILDTGQEEVEEYRMRRKDGSEIWVEDHGYYIHNEQGMPIYHEGMLRDITARKQVEKSLQKLKKAVDTSTDAIFLTDMDGIFTYINPGFSTLYGYGADEVVGKVTSRILKSGLLDPQVYNELWENLINGREAKGELINKRKNGKLIDIDVSATPIFDEANNMIGFLSIQRDITERKKAEEALQTAEENYRAIFENATVGIYQSTPQGRFLSVNPAMARMFGYDSPVEMLKNIVNIEKQYYVNSGVRHEFKRLMSEQGEVREFCSWNYRKDGEHIWIEESARAVKDAQGNILYYEGFVSDITRRKQSEDELHRAKESLETANRELEHVLMREQQLARTDGLTGLYNYRYFFELASREFSASMRYHRPLTILMFDTDDFKGVNDTLGHTVGDKILTLVAQATARQMRTVDVLARYGGDEFVILLSQTSAQQAFPIAERIRASVAALQMQTETGLLAVTLSIGIAEISREPADESVERIVQRADKALYAAKQAGRNRTVIYDPDGTGAIG